MGLPSDGEDHLLTKHFSVEGQLDFSDVLFAPWIRRDEQRWQKPCSRVPPQADGRNTRLLTDRSQCDRQRRMMHDLSLCAFSIHDRPSSLVFPMALVKRAAPKVPKSKSRGTSLIAAEGKK